MPAKKQLSVLSGQLSDTGKSVVSKSVSKTEKRKTDKPDSENRKPRTDIRKNNLSVPVYSLIGRVSGNLDLPKEVFGAKVNIGLLAQAIRVYSSNQKAHFSNTKTRGEVTASTKKIYAQKGTGRARHGANSAPIFVGGGVALGPKYRKIELDLPKKMKKAALISALSQKASDGLIVAVTGLDKQTGKTKEMAQLLMQLNSKFKIQNSKLGTALILVGEKNENALRATRNLKGVSVLLTDQLNAFEVIKHQSLVLTKKAVEKLQERFTKKQ